MSLRPAAIAFVLSAAATATFAAERGLAKVTVAGKAVSIDYGRPSLQGRDMLGRAQVGEAWRMGADSPTQLKTKAEVSFGEGKVVAPGDYVLTATKIDPEKWQLNVKKSDGSTVDVPLVSKTLSEPVETFTIELKGDGNKGELALKWGTLSLSTPFTAR
jgi:hypothetical protein